jgi:hypothetical protein
MDDRPAIDSQHGFPASESLENQGLQEPKIDQSGKRRELAFEQINEVTWKLTDGGGIIAWEGNRSGGYRTTHAVAWLMGVGNGKWIVRYRNKASKPTRLPKAREYTLEMVRGIWAGRALADPIGHLHQECLKTIGEDHPKPPAPLNVMGAGHQWDKPAIVSRDTVAEILCAECPMLVDMKPPPSLPAPPLQGDDYPLEYDEDGHPKLPACLDRRKPK